MSTNKNDETRWFKTPKDMLISEDYKELSVYAKLWLPNLFSLNNSFKGGNFHQSMKDIQFFTGLSPHQIRKAKKDLKKFGVKITRKGNDVFFNVSEVYERYIQKEKY